MELTVIGISHKKAPLEIREKFSIRQSQFKDAQESLKRLGGIEGVIILSTCNRTEIYIHPADEKTADIVIRFLSDKFEATKEDIKNYFYTLSDVSALRHLYSVACGLDSQVLGEIEILGQIKSAWQASKDAGFSGMYLNRVFEKALEIGSYARRATGISHGNVSVGSVAVKKLKAHFSDLRNKEVLIVGAGKIANLMSKHLKAEGIKGFFVSNRTYQKACELAQECNGEAVHFDRLSEMLAKVDIVISSTSSPHIVLKKGLVEEVMALRQRPLILIDLALPRDIDPDVKEIQNIFLYDLDDLKSVIEDNFNKRKKEALKVQKIIEGETSEKVLR